MAEINESQLNIGSSVEGLQPSLEAAPVETEITTVSPTQVINPTVGIESTDVKGTQPQVQNFSTKVNTSNKGSFDINAPIKEGSTWLEILGAKKLREELPQ